jgi:hypothetical protein
VDRQIEKQIFDSELRMLKNKNLISESTYSEVKAAHAKYHDYLEYESI